MKHIAATRLMQLCAEAVVQDEHEEAHLKLCQDCRMLLRAFAEDRAKYLQRQRLIESARTENGDDNDNDRKDFSKSA